MDTEERAKGQKMNPTFKRIIWASSIAVLTIFAASAFVCMRFWQAMHTDPCPNPQIHVAETGLEAINKDAQIVFERFGSTSSESFYPELGALKSFPALADLTRRLGDYSAIFLEPRRGVELEHLRIRCGNHFNCHFIYVFDPRIPIDTNGSMFQRLQPITNNVFLRM
jgi:hypothetical protein